MPSMTFYRILDQILNRDEGLEDAWLFDAEYHAKLYRDVCDIIAVSVASAKLKGGE